VVAVAVRSWGLEIAQLTLLGLRMLRARTVAKHYVVSAVASAGGCLVLFVAVIAVVVVCARGGGGEGRLGCQIGVAIMVLVMLL